MSNLATKDERYPLVYVAPAGAIPDLDLNTLTIEVRCYDIIQKDRANITTILSDTNQILNDIFLFIKEGEDEALYTIDNPAMTPLNNDLLDYAAGWSMIFSLQLEGFNECEIPRPE